MKKKTLIETNPYLRDPKERKRLLQQSVISSFGVEGIKITKKDLKKSYTINKLYHYLHELLIKLFTHRNP